MKLGLISCALAAALGAAACGGNGSLVTGCDPGDAYCGPSGGGSSSSSGGGTSRDAGTSVHEAGGAETGAEAAASGSSGGGTAGSSSSSSGGVSSGSSGGGGSGAGAAPGVCVPGAACGGLWECRDDCYTDKCCQLSCDCTDPTGQSGALQCSLTCP